MSEVKAGFLFPVKLFFKVCQEVHINSYGFTPITAKVIIYMFYLLFYSSGLYLTFFYCYIILEGFKKKIFFFKLRGKKRSTLL